MKIWIKRTVEGIRRDQRRNLWKVGRPDRDITIKRDRNKRKLTVTGESGNGR